MTNHFYEFSDTIAPNSRIPKKVISSVTFPRFMHRLGENSSEKQKDPQRRAI